MRADVLPAGSKGCDTSAATSRSQARALKNAGMAFILRSVDGHDEAHQADNLSARELEELVAEGLAVGAYQLYPRVASEWSSEAGHAAAVRAVEKAKAAGYAAGSVLWCDLEGDDLSSPGVMARAGAWADYVHSSPDSPYWAGAYRVRWLPETVSQLRVAGFSYLWDAADGTPPLAGSEMVQGKQATLAGVVIDPDVTQARIPFTVADGAATEPAPPPSDTMPSGVVVDVGAFTFALLPGETVRERIVRCCDEAAAFGPMGKHTLRARYAAFVGLECVDVATSCAVVQGAIDDLCRREGAPARPRHLIGAPMMGGGNVVGWLGKLNMGHPSWRPYRPSMKPRPGDMPYVQHATNPNNNHVVRVLRELSPGVWECFEGGGGQGTLDDGTLTHKTTRVLAHFDSRPLLGWFDADEMGYAAF